MFNGFEPAIIKRLEQIAGHKFANIGLLSQALTHSSFCANEVNRHQKNYERLEFLGDRVLGLCVAKLLYTNFPEAKEGELSKRFNALVNTEICAKIAEETGLNSLVRLGSELRSKTDKPHVNIYADITEAFIAAIFLDAGLDAAYGFVEKYWQALTQEDYAEKSDAKTALQEWAHKQNGAQPVYRVLERRGVDHDPVFLIEVCVAGFEPICAEGASKRKAQSRAAKKMLQREGIW